PDRGQKRSRQIVVDNCRRQPEIVTALLHPVPSQRRQSRGEALVLGVLVAYTSPNRSSVDPNNSAGRERNTADDRLACRDAPVAVGYKDALDSRPCGLGARLPELPCLQQVQ